jgi:hypothetical protein
MQGKAMIVNDCRELTPERGKDCRRESQLKSDGPRTNQRLLHSFFRRGMAATGVRRTVRWRDKIRASRQESFPPSRLAPRNR